MDANDSTLIEILANTDAAFLPIRGEGNTFTTVGKAGIVAYQMRGIIRSVGVNWFRPGVGDAARKAAQRGREELAKLKLVTLRRRRSDRAVGCALTPAGDSRARGLAELPSLADALGAMRRIEKLRDDPDTAIECPMACGPGPWVHETRLAGAAMYDRTLYGTREARQRLVEIENQLLPALTRGWALSATGAGVWYSLTAEGLAALGVDVQRESAPPADEEARAIYLETVQATLAHFTSIDPPDPRDIAFPIMSHSPLTRGQVAKA